MPADKKENLSAAEEKAAKEEAKRTRAKLEEEVGKFDIKKWDEIARWLQKQKRFESRSKQAPMYVRVGPRQEFSSVRQYMSGKNLTKIIASKPFTDKFGLTFTRENAEVLLCAMLAHDAPKADPKKNYDRRYLVQAEYAQSTPVVKLRLAGKANLSKTTIKLDQPYVWVFQGSLMWRHILLGTLVVIFLAACLFPVWPDFMKLGVWYLAVTLLLFLFAFFVARGLIFLVLWIAGYNFWIFPNVLDDDLPPIESFKPLYSFEPHAQSRSGWMYRISLGIVLFAMTYWVYVQPNAYHAQMLDEQRSFVDDLYSGKFLSDRSEAAADNLDEVIPDYEELLQEELADGELSEEDKLLNEILAEEELAAAGENDEVEDE